MNEQLVFNIDEESIIFQSNTLAMGSYDMTALEQKIFLILVSTISKDDTDFKKTTFRVVDLANLLDVSPQMLYRDLKKICKSIISKVVEVKNDEGDWTVFNILSSAKYKNKEGTVELKINDEATPYLLQLKELFLSFKLENILDIDGKYTIRIYQQAKSNLFKKDYIITLDDFKKQLKLTQKSYDRFSNINLKVLTPAIEEINKKTDITIEVEALKVGKKVHSLRFSANKKLDNKQKVTAKRNKQEINPKSFNNFEPREYNWNKLEQQLLGWDKD